LHGLEIKLKDQKKNFIARFARAAEKNFFIVGGTDKKILPLRPLRLCGEPIFSVSTA